MAALAPGTSPPPSRFHFRVRWGGQRDQHPAETRHVRRRRADKGLAGAHLADHGGAPVGLEGEGSAPDGVGLAPHRGAGAAGAA